MTLGISVASACVIDSSSGHTAAVHQPMPDKKLVCLNLCADEQASVVKAEQLHVGSWAQMAPAIGLNAITVTLFDSSDRPRPAAILSAHEIPVSIRFLQMAVGGGSCGSPSLEAGE
jgi:hypothetical protein